MSDVGYHLTIKISDVRPRVSDIGYTDIGFHISAVKHQISDLNIQKIFDTRYSNIRCHTSDIKYLISDLIYGISNIKYQITEISWSQISELRSPILGYPISDIGYQISEFRFRNSDIKCRTSDLIYRISDIGYHISDNRYQNHNQVPSDLRPEISDIRYSDIQISNIKHSIFRYQISDIGQQISDFRFHKPDIICQLYIGYRTPGVGSHISDIPDNRNQTIFKSQISEFRSPVFRHQISDIG